MLNIVKEKILEVLAWSKHKYGVKKKTKSSKNPGKFKLASNMNKDKRKTFWKTFQKTFRKRMQHLLTHLEKLLNETQPTKN